MPATNPDELVKLNDPCLEPLIRAERECIEREIERLIVGVAQPLIAAIASRYVRSNSTVSLDDADDITGTIHLRLVARLRAVPRSPEDAVGELEKYVATLTYNVINDHLREIFPERTRLKSRLRYALLHDPRLALWSVGDTLVCGLSFWRGSDVLAAEPAIDAANAPVEMCDPTRPADALVLLFQHTGRAVTFDGVVNCIAAVWNIVDAPASPEPDLGKLEAAQPMTADSLEAREMLRALWREIRELRPPQRKALLLNLRGYDSGDVASLLVMTGIAPFDELAAALEMAPEELAALWYELPLDDQRIAAILGVTRQQVINLRKSARSRLARRVSR